MKRSSISYLKAHLSAELKAVQAGETVVVMDREHPIARLVPMAEKKSLEIREPLRPFGFEKLAPLISGGSLERLLEDRGRR
jgi:prevent-host-death family protein